MGEKWCTAYREALGDAEEELYLLRCALRCMMAEGESRELTSLWRLSDYLEQHIADLRRLSC